MGTSAAVEHSTGLSLPFSGLPEVIRRVKAMDEGLISEQLELQQHDWICRLSYKFELERRDFFKLLGAGLLVYVCSGRTPAQESGHRAHSEDDLPKSIDAWIHIAEDGKITVYTGKVEVGQNIRTSLSQQVAEELRVPISSIKMVMGDTDLTPYDMGTFGSRTTPTMGPQLRNAAGSARLALIAMAAERWHAAESDLIADDGKISNKKTKQSITYSDLAKPQRLVAKKMIPGDPALTPAANWSIAGTSIPKI